jgi:release factor glutamine methyltransferase
VRRPTVPGLRPGAATEATVGGVLARLGRSVDPVDAEWLVSHVLGMSRSELALRAREPVAAAEQDRLAVLAARRTAGEPLQYVLGEWGFRRLTLTVDRRALIPRPETEIVVERCLALLAGLDRPRVLDVGTGSGAIALAIADEHTGARVTGLDVSVEALALARENAERTGVRLELVERDAFAGLPDGPWELVVSNPPYVDPDERASLAPEVRDWEPATALFGRQATEAVARGALPVLAAGGSLVLEVGDGQAGEVGALLGRLWYRYVASTRDLAGRDRVVEGRVP